MSPLEVLIVLQVLEAGASLIMAFSLLYMAIREGDLGGKRKGS